jgi:hypothetical protein
MSAMELPGVPDDDTVEEEIDEEIILGPDGIDEPETAWSINDEPASLPPVTGDTFVLLRPGEELEAVEKLPKPKSLRLGLAIRLGELVLCVGRRRSWCRTSLGPPGEKSGLPLAQGMVAVFIRHRARGVRGRPRNYIAVIGENEALLGWLDYSDGWNFDAHILEMMAREVGIGFSIERFATEPDFELAHPDWVG